tara:strand:+ start:593 stop:880 length:288 start_codon:yes stop_codon:yes gene_type:complete
MNSVFKGLTTTNKFGTCYICEWKTSTAIPVDDMLIHCCADRTCKESFKKQNFTHTLINKRHVYPKQRIQEYLWTYPRNALIDENVYIGVGNTLGA